MLISDLEVGMPFGLSDHDSVAFLASIENTTTRKEPKAERTLDWNSANWCAFSKYCGSVDWDEVIDESLSVDELWGVLTNVLNIGIKTFIPLRKIRNVKPRKRYESKRIKKQKAIKLKLWRKLKKSKSTKNKKKYRKAAKKLKAKTATEHQQIELKVINSNDLANFYKHVNKNSAHKTGIGPLKNTLWIISSGE